MAKPILFFTPGAWHTPEVFTTVITKLQSHGYKCIAHPLIAVGHSPAVQSLKPDLAAIHGAVFDEIHEHGNEVIMVAHSWSGIVASGALEGLSKAERELEGERGGVTRLVFVSAFVPLEGVSLIQAFGGEKPDWYDVKVMNAPSLQSYLSKVDGG
jgi:pimeloyl-ACP methyl ester carboxylesterase